VNSSIGKPRKNILSCRVVSCRVVSCRAAKCESSLKGKEVEIQYVVVNFCDTIRETSFEEQSLFLSRSHACMNACIYMTLA
jgi:hypothetical protein